jgi:hypothetical protein
MYLRENNIIVCDCGVELNPKIVTVTDYIKYVDGVAMCSNCETSQAIEIVNPANTCSTCGQAIPEIIPE